MPARVIQKQRGNNNHKQGSNNVICDRSGFKAPVEACRMEWNGLFVLKRFWERRQPQDLLRGFPDRQQPKVSRPGTGDVFVGVNEVKAEDL